MPQMFPLLWTFLFLSTAIMLMSMMTMMFFKEKPVPYLFHNDNKSPKALWKW